MSILNFHIPKRTIFLLLVLAGMIQVACKKSSSGSPVITHVRAVDSTARDSFFVTALTGSLIDIQGQNLDGLQAVYFNGLSATYNPALNSGTNIIITIPTNAPTSPPLSSVPNTIKVVTNHGSATYTFNLVLPAPIITAVSNENATAGTSITIYGSNFYGITKVTFPGGIDVTSPTVNDSSTQISVAVPSGITAGDSIRVTGTFGTSVSPFVFDNWLSPTFGFLANFDIYNGSSQWSPPSVTADPYYGWSQNQWDGAYITNSSTFPGGTGDCVEMDPQNNKPAGDNSWWQDNNGIMTDSTATLPAWVQSSSASISNYALKFEAFVNNWTAGSIWITTNRPTNNNNNTWSYMAEYAPWKTASTGKYSTNGWLTVTIPLTSFLSCKNNVYTSGGSPASSIAALYNIPSGYGGFMFMYANDGTTTIPGGSFAMAIDNVRVVPIN